MALAYASQLNDLIQDFLSAVSVKTNTPLSELTSLWNKQSTDPVKREQISPRKAVVPSSGTPELQKLSKPELVELCRRQKLKITGTKQDLIARLDMQFQPSLSSQQSLSSQSTDNPSPKQSASNVQASMDSKVKNLVQIQAPKYRITRNSFGNYCHTETGLVYDRDLLKFIGKQHSSGRVDSLTDEDIETCNQYRFPYLLPENLSKSTKATAIPELDENELVGEDDDDLLEEEEEVVEELPDDE